MARNKKVFRISKSTVTTATVEPEVREPNPDEPEMGAAAPAPTPEPTGPAPLPVIEGVQVIEVLKDGKETPTHYHVRMADGTTRHVAKQLIS